MGNMSLATVLNIPPQVSCTRKEPALVVSAWALLHDQMMTPFTQPGSVPATVKRQNHGNFQRAAPPEMERLDAL